MCALLYFLSARAVGEQMGVNNQGFNAYPLSPNKQAPFIVPSSNAFASSNNTRVTTASVVH